MKRILCIAIAFMALSLSYAQKNDGVVRGMLTDSAAGKGVEDATISIIQKKDSSLVTYALSNRQGLFEIKGLKNGFYRVIISHQEYGEVKKNISITEEEKRIDFGKIFLFKEYKLLGEVTISNESPIIIKNDTIQFNAGSFRTRPNATLEDLMKKLPGVEVDKQGNVKTQGEQVQKVYVDGREFFANDPRLATKNLSADMVESIQVFDDMSDQAKFTRIDDGSRSKAINIKLKKDRNKGYFGRALAGYGDKGRYIGNLGLNKFSTKQRMSFFSSANNVNRQGGGDGDSKGFMTRGSNLGLTQSFASAFNYNDEWGSKIKLSGNYIFSGSSTKREQSVLKETTFVDSLVSLSIENSSKDKNRDHQFSLRLEYKIDSVNSIIYTPSVGFTQTDNNNIDTSFAISQTPDFEYLSITGKNDSKNRREGKTFGNNLLFRHRFRKLGRTMTIGWKNILDNSANNISMLSNNKLYQQGGNGPAAIGFNQQSEQKVNTNNNEISISYTEPISSVKILELNYAHTHDANTSDKRTYDYNFSTDSYDILNLIFTNKFENLFLAHRIGANFRVQQKNYNYQFGMSVQNSTLKNSSYQALSGKDSLSRGAYINFFPSANFNFTPKRNKTLRLNYNGRTNQPTVEQLQNVLNVSDPLNVQTGNPNLKQEFSHNLNVQYNTFNTRSFKLFTANIGISFSNNKIVNSIDTLSRGVQLLKPVNINGFYRATSFLTFGFPFRSPELKGSNVNFSNNISYTNDVSQLYKQKNNGQTLSVTQGVNVSLTKEKFDISIRANMIYTSLNYSVNKSFNQDYFSQDYSGDFSYIFKEKFILSTNFSYYVSRGRSDGYNQQIPLWNASLSKELFKKRNGELRVTVNDILNQNQDIIRNVGDNYIYDVRSTVLKRFFMVSLFYKLTKSATRKKSE